MSEYTWHPGIDSLLYMANINVDFAMLTYQSGLLHHEIHASHDGFALELDPKYELVHVGDSTQRKLIHKHSW